VIGVPFVCGAAPFRERGLASARALRAQSRWRRPDLSAQAVAEGLGGVGVAVETVGGGWTLTVPALAVRRGAFPRTHVPVLAGVAGPVPADLGRPDLGDDEYVPSSAESPDPCPVPRHPGLPARPAPGRPSGSSTGGGGTVAYLGLPTRSPAACWAASSPPRNLAATAWDACHGPPSRTRPPPVFLVVDNWASHRNWGRRRVCLATPTRLRCMCHLAGARLRAEPGRGLVSVIAQGAQPRRLRPAAGWRPAVAFQTGTTPPPRRSAGRSTRRLWMTLPQQKSVSAFPAPGRIAA